jgi:hypothetical protein
MGHRWWKLLLLLWILDPWHAKPGRWSDFALWCRLWWMLLRIENWLRSLEWWEVGRGSHVPFLEALFGVWLGISTLKCREHRIFEVSLRGALGLRGSTVKHLLSEAWWWRRRRLMLLLLLTVEFIHKLLIKEPRRRSPRESGCGLLGVLIIEKNLKGWIIGRLV